MQSMPCLINYVAAGTSLPHCHSSRRPLCFLSWDGRGEQQCMHASSKKQCMHVATFSFLFSLEENDLNSLICYLVQYLYLKEDTVLHYCAEFWYLS